MTFPGCDYCSAPAGVDILHVWGEELERDYKDVPFMDQHAWGAESKVCSVACISQETLKGDIQDLLKSIYEGSGPEMFSDWAGRDVASEDMAAEIMSRTVFAQEKA
jgi:hypothetical protein